MESCNEKNFPRAGPTSDGESRTVSEKSSDAVWPKYTGGATIASGSKEAAETANAKGGANTRNNPGPALFTAPDPDQQRRTRRKDLTTTKDLATTNVATSNMTYQTPAVGVQQMDDSDCSLYTMKTASSRESSHDRAGSVTGKRRLPHSGSASDGGSEHSMCSESSSRRKLTPAKRGRGRPPTTGEYVGYAAARRKHLEREALSLQEEKVATEAAALTALKEDTLRLEAENIRLKEELARLREKVSQAQEAPTRPPVPTSASKGPRATNGSEELTMASLKAMFEDFSRSIMERTSSMINARIEAMEDRLLPAQRIRPPLAADSKRQTKNTQQSQDFPALPRVRSSTRVTSSAPARTAKAAAAPTPAAKPEIEKRVVEEKKKNMKGKKNIVKENPALQLLPAPSTSSAPGPSTTGEAWNVVTT